MKILIFGASGAGTTTLGASLGKTLNWKHLDADDYYWEKTSPPFQIKIPLEERNLRLTKDYQENDSVIISGSLVTWGAHWQSAFDLAIFLLIPPEARMKRLANREMERYGNLLKTDENKRLNSKAFLDWAKKYDDEQFDGRSIRQHRAWIKVLQCPTLIIEGDTTNDQRLDLVIAKIQS